ncbi:MAG: T9SS type A sorting domain-containing protein [Bacteroidetes bacterium]|nr:T9SS type A sorting domain-containing protein [Bacteroidota bacterium]
MKNNRFTKSVLISLLLLFSICSMYAQSESEYYVEYSYDDAGNRYSRLVIELRETATILSNNPTSPLSQIPQQDTTAEESLASIVSMNCGGVKVTVFPNPTYGILTLSFTENLSGSNALLSIQDEAGLLISQKEINAVTQKVDFSELPTGIYILKISIGKSEKSFKIIKSKKHI